MTKPKIDIDRILEKNKSREFISQFIYHGHGSVCERLARKKVKRCEGCESDIDAIIDEIKHNMIDIIEIIKDNVNHELDRFEFPIIAIRKGMDFPAKEQLEEVKKSREDLRKRINKVIK